MRVFWWPSALRARAARAVRRRRDRSQGRVSSGIERLESRALLSAAGAWSGPYRSALPVLTTTASQAPLYLQGERLELEMLVPATAQAAPLLSLDLFRSDVRFAGIDGTGFTSVVIDTGIDRDHSFFGPDMDGNGVADRIVFSYDFSGTNDADASDVDGHGSNVASIIASSDGTYPGVAPGAGVIALKVFADNGSGSFGDVEQALQWVVAHVAEYNIASVNMSLGDSSNSTTTQQKYGISDELAQLAAMNVIVVSAAGNDFARFQSAVGVSYPAADPNSLAVGAVYDADVGSFSYVSGATAYTTGADRITPFSQRHSTLTTVFAPGAPITGAAEDGGTVTMHGTSQAAPQVAGMAVLAQQLAVQTLGRRLTVAEFRNLVRQTGTVINDGDDENDNVTNSNLTFRRADMQRLGESILAMGVVVVNAAPTVTLETTPLAFTENDPAVFLDPQATVVDTDSADLATGTLVVSIGSGGTAQDRLAVRAQGTGPGQFSVSGSTLRYGTTAVGSLTGGTGTTPLSIAWTAAASPAVAQALLRNLTFQVTGENPAVGDRTIRVVMTDGDGGTSLVVTRTVSVTAVNDAPQLAFRSAAPTYLENAAGVALDAAATVLAPDAVNFQGGVLTVAFTAGTSAGDLLEIRHQGLNANQIGVSGTDVLFSGRVIGSFAGGTPATPLTVTLNTLASPSAVQALLRNLTLRVPGEAIASGTRTLTIQLTDGAGGTSNLVTRSVAVRTVNDNPVVSWANPAPTFVENGAAVQPITQVTVSDVDSADFAGGRLTVSVVVGGTASDRLAVAHVGMNPGEIGVSGNLVTYGGTTIGTLAGGTGTTPLTVTLNGNANPAAVQALLANVTFSVVGDNPSLARRTLRVQLADGDGGISLPANGNVAVQATNDAPTLNLPSAAPSYALGTAAPVLLDAAASLQDVDTSTFPGAVLTVNSTAGGGANDRFEVSNQGRSTNQVGVVGATVYYSNVAVGLAVGGSNGAPLTVIFNSRATLAAVQAVLRNVLFRVNGNDGSTGARTVEVTITDGSGGTSAPVQKTINVNA